MRVSTIKMKLPFSQIYDMTLKCLFKLSVYFRVIHLIFQFFFSVGRLRNFTIYDDTPETPVDDHKVLIFSSHAFIFHLFNYNFFSSPSSYAMYVKRWTFDFFPSLYLAFFIYRQICNYNFCAMYIWEEWNGGKRRRGKAP